MEDVPWGTERLPEGAEGGTRWLAEAAAGLPPGLGLTPLAAGRVLVWVPGVLQLLVNLDSGISAK